MPGATSRLTMPLPLGADAVSELRLAITAIANTLDTAALARSGTLAARPAANTLPPDTLYRCTDTPAWYVNDGSVWHYLPLDGGSQPVGAITQYASTTDPVDADGTTRWLVCDGRTIPAASFPTLFSRVGVVYGGNSTNFAIPDLRGRTAIGYDPGGVHLPVNRPALGSSSAGEETHLLLSAESGLPTHNHTYGDHLNFAGFGQGSPILGNAVGSVSTGTTGNNTSANASSVHNNMQPYLAVNHIIKVL